MKAHSLARANALQYVFLIYLNYLARDTNKIISERFPTVLTPKGFAFSIWGFIFLLQGICVLYMLSGGVNASTERLGLTWIIGWGAQNLWQFSFQMAYKFAIEDDKTKMLIFHVVCLTCLLVSFVCFITGFYRVVIGYRQDYERFAKSFYQQQLNYLYGTVSPTNGQVSSQEKEPLVTGFSNQNHGSLQPFSVETDNSEKNETKRNVADTYTNEDEEMDSNPGAAYLIYMISSVNAAWLSVATLIGMLVTLGAFNGVYDDVAFLHDRYQLPTYINLAVILLVFVMILSVYIASSFDTFSYIFTIMWALYGITQSDNVVPLDLRVFANFALNSLCFSVFMISLFKLIAAFAMLSRRREVIIV